MRGQVLNKHMDHMKAEQSQKVWEKNVFGPLTAFPTVREPVGSPFPSSIENTSESKMDIADVVTSLPLLPEEEKQFLLRCSGLKRRATMRYTPPISDAESEKPDPVLKEELQNKELTYVLGTQRRRDIVITK
eukprot:g22891.t1